MTHNPKRGDKALNPRLCSNGKVAAVFGNKVYIRWEGQAKTNYYPRHKLVWFEEGSAWVSPSAGALHAD